MIGSEPAAWVRNADPTELREASGLEGRWRRWMEPPSGASGLIVGMGELAPGETAGWHQHVEPELFVVLEGSGEARWRDGDRLLVQPLAPGSAFFKVGDVPHQMANTGTRAFRGLFVKLAVE